MSRRLLILRHAKSSWDTPASTDFERPLAKRGLRDAPRLGQWLKQRKLQPDHVVSSPAERARQTVTLVCEELGIKKKKIHWESAIYNADVGDLLRVLGAIPAESQLAMIVGHNPGLEFLASYLAEIPEEAVIDGGLIKTATAVLIDLPDDWSDLTSGCGTIEFVQHPKQIDP